MFVNPILLEPAKNVGQDYKEVIFREFHLLRTHYRDCLLKLIFVCFWISRQHLQQLAVIAWYERSIET